MRLVLFAANVALGFLNGVLIGKVWIADIPPFPASLLTIQLLVLTVLTAITLQRIADE